MRILFISHSSEIGGAENMLLLMIKIAQNEGFECHCIFPNVGILEEKARALNIKTHISKLRWCVEVNKKPLLHFHEGLNERVASIKEIIQLNSIDLVITNTIVVIEGALAAKLAGVPHLWRIAELLNSDPSLKSVIALKFFYTIVLSLSEKILVVAEAVKKEIEQFTGITSQKVVVIYDGLIPKKITRDHRDLDENIVFSAGNICPRKGFETFLKAAWHVRQRIPDVKFFVAGRVTDSVYYKKLLSLRRKLKMDKTFELLGFRDDVCSLMNKSRVFVLASTSEPFGVVLLEAMNVGLPIVTTDSGGPAEAVIDGKTGFVVPVNDEIMMAKKIEQLLINKEDAIRMGSAGHDRLQEVYQFEKMELGISNIIKESISKRTDSSFDITFSLPLLLDLISSLQIGEGAIPRMANFYKRIRENGMYKILSTIKKSASNLISNFKNC